jgi:hypothetical protein
LSIINIQQSDIEEEATGPLAKLHELWVWLSTSNEWGYDPSTIILRMITGLAVLFVFALVFLTIFGVIPWIISVIGWWATLIPVLPIASYLIGRGVVK